MGGRHAKGFFDKVAILRLRRPLLRADPALSIGISVTKLVRVGVDSRLDSRQLGSENVHPECGVGTQRGFSVKTKIRGPPFYQKKPFACRPRIEDDRFDLKIG